MKNSKQIVAADPSFSLWVSASAGTGKTKILTDRVMRLLLLGEKMHKILCLTFTNAGAFEMQDRISKILFKYATLEEKSLTDELLNIGFERSAINSTLLKRSKNLYNEFLSAEHSINILTIHSFCQKLLRKFPIEAGIAPKFQIIDDIESDKIINQVKSLILEEKVIFLQT